jgi:TetR/AcrR family transcriptional repressor of nem operon
MKRSREATAETRRTIIQAAARQFRKRGFGGIGVADVMAQAGLTHGGFYKHFASKNALAAEACNWALEVSTNQLASIAAATPPGQGLRAIVHDYLSMEHRDHAEKGCVIAALAADAARLDVPTKRAFAKGQDALVSLIAAQLPASNADPIPAAKAILSTMVGALLMSRTIDDRKQAESFLQSARDALLQQY